MRNRKVQIFYNDKQVLNIDPISNASKSPLKPRLIVQKLHSEGLIPSHFEIHRNFRPFCENDFKIAHRERYVHNFFRGEEGCESNGLKWSPQFADSVRFTNASLYNAIRQSILSRGRDVCFSPTSGFHHAKPGGGVGFCTFSGQVIASMKLYREFGVSGAYLDLDGHFGNSIEDASPYVKDLSKAIPSGCNINIDGQDMSYHKNLCLQLKRLESMILNDEIQYLVWCHGADSHEWDDMGGGANTHYWMQCATTFWSWLSAIDAKLGRPFPVSMSLFGGYRRDAYSSVIDLHVGDIVECLNNLLGHEVEFTPNVVPKPSIVDLAFAKYRDDK